MKQFDFFKWVEIRLLNVIDVWGKFEVCVIVFVQIMIDINWLLLYIDGKVIWFEFE